MSWLCTKTTLKTPVFVQNIEFLCKKGSFCAESVFAQKQMYNRYMKPTREDALNEIKEIARQLTHEELEAMREKFDEFEKEREQKESERLNDR